MSDDRYQRGWDKLKEVDGEAGERVMESLKDIAPDLARYVIEFPFGDVYSRPGLDLKSREIAVVAALTALGNATPQLKVHINGALIAIARIFVRLLEDFSRDRKENVIYRVHVSPTEHAQC